MEIVCEGVVKEIQNRKIVNNISLKVEKGTAFGLVGPNGAGKTTLVRLMLGLYNLSEGKIYINKVDTRSKEFGKIKPQIGVLLDSLGLYKDLTAWENIEFYDRIYFPRSTKQERIKRIQNSLELVDLIDKSNDKITFFSRGMRQRLALARTFNSKPKLLILDEPSRGLDLDGQFAVRNFIHILKNEGTTVFINSHNLGELQKTCDKFGFIKKGSIVDTGTFDELMNKYSGKENSNFDLESIYHEVNK